MLTTYFKQDHQRLIRGFSKLTKSQKLEQIAAFFTHPQELIRVLKSFWHSDTKKQRLFDEFSENTLSNFYFPYGVAPNFLIDGQVYLVPMVIEESSVVAAASNAAKFWSERGGFHTEVVATKKVGQVHFSWPGNIDRLQADFPQIERMLRKRTASISANMEGRGGGILDMQIVDKTRQMSNYYQLVVRFDTVDSMGANFINSCLEEMSDGLADYFARSPLWNGAERQYEPIMSILSNYTPECIVRAAVTCPVKDLVEPDSEVDAETFVRKFEKAVRIAQIDVSRATTHNKGIFNGIDAVVLATGNDFRAVEAAGHTYAARNGHYSGLTQVQVKDGIFTYSLELPLALGTVGGLTGLHPLARLSMEMLGQPTAPQLMRIVAAAGLANNFGALKSLVTKGIQLGHMKVHLLNILNHYQATSLEKDSAIEYFKTQKVSFHQVKQFLQRMRSQHNGNLS